MNENPAVNYRIEYFPERRRRNERWSVLDASGKPIMHGSARECVEFKRLMERHGYSDEVLAKAGTAA